MSIADLIPTIQSLPRQDKIALARLLLDDLAKEDLLAALKPGQEWPIYTPEFAPGAAAQLARLLDNPASRS